MKNKLIEHLTGIVFVTIILLLLLATIHSINIRKENYEGLRVKPFLNAPISNADDRFQRSLLKDVMNIYYPDQHETNDTIVKEILSIKGDQFSRKLQSSHIEQTLSIKTLMNLSVMYLEFLIVYIIVMLLTYYGVQTLASWRFVRNKHKEYLAIHLTENEQERGIKWTDVIYSVFRTIAYLILFSPAYVIAYSIRTEFNTDSAIFMIFLGVISNGLLVMYTNKFYAFLVSESRKGFIDTARVKNLNENFSFSQYGIPAGALLSPFKRFKGHLFDHIFKNAHFQYLSTIKEQASFLITGLVIIEMALNIHGHLNYEMLRQILYKNYDIVVVIVLMIFYTVKMTEVFTDFLIYKESKKYENR